MSNSFDNAIKNCPDLSLRIILKKLSMYDDYIRLSEANDSTYNDLLKLTPFVPQQLKYLYKLYNGGYLFDTVLLSTEDFDAATGNRLLNIKQINSRCHSDCDLPKNYIAFAVSSFGDLYCFDTAGSSEIIQWSIIEHKAVYRWSSFYIWLNNDITTAIELIDEQIILPFVE